MTSHCPTCRCHRAPSLRQQLRLRKLRGDRLGVEDVAGMVAQETSIEVERMMSRSQDAEVVRARRMAIQLSFAFCGTTKSEIARVLNLTRSTVLYHLRRTA